MHEISARIAILSVWSLVALAPLGGAGCHVGSAEETPSGDSPDAASGGGDDGEGVDAGDDGGEVAPTECTTLEAVVTDDGHHPKAYDYTTGGSKGCITAGCHDGQTPTAPLYTIAGAVYDGLGVSGEPIAGAHVYVTDSAQKVVHMVTARNGFFYTSEPVTPPLITHASGCPDRMPMATPATGNCNGSGCHGPNFKIYLGSP